MGPNQTHSLQLNSQAMSQYQIIERSTQSQITYLKNIKNNQQYLLREHRFNQLRQFTTLSERLEKRIKLKHRNLTNLQKMQTKTEDQLCSNFFKIFTLWEYPKHSLVNEISDRILKNRNFEDKELWNIILSVIQPMVLLQTNDFRHQTLSSKTILIDHQGIIKVADTFTNTYQNNLQFIYAHRSLKNIYLSPEQCESIVTQKPIINKNPYKNDVFTFGLIILECGLLQSQQKCYFEEYQGINWRLLGDITNHFGNIYGLDLKKTVEIMTKQTYNERPSWIQLSNFISTIKINGIPNNFGKKVSQNNSYEISSTNSNHHPFSTSLSSNHPPSININTNQVQGVYYTPVTHNPNISQNIQPVISANQRANNQDNITIKVGGNPISNLTPLSVKPYERVINTTSSQSVPLFNHHHYSQISPYNQINHNPTIVFNHTQHVQPKQINFTGTFNRQTFIVNPPVINQHQTSNTINMKKQVKTTANKEVMSYIYNQSPKKDSEQLQFVQEKFKMGSRYQGYKLNGMRHGRGKFYYQDGGSYDGQWKMNKMNGYGKLYYQSNKLAYQGDWIDDQFQGRGKLYNENPIFIQAFNYLNFDQIDDSWDYYQGQFLSDLKNGKGKLKFSSGQIFQGHFFDDMVQGEGRFMFNDGRIIRGIWHQNQLKEYIK